MDMEMEMDGDATEKREISDIVKMECWHIQRIKSIRYD